MSNLDLFPTELHLESMTMLADLEGDLIALLRTLDMEIEDIDMFRAGLLRTESLEDELAVIGVQAQVAMSRCLSGSALAQSLFQDIHLIIEEYPAVFYRCFHEGKSFAIDHYGA